MRILLIEDSDAIRKIQRAILTRLGHSDFAEAATGADGLALCQSFNPEMIFADASLPDIDGVDVVKTIRATGSTTPVIFLASTAEMASILPAIRAGADEALIKPFIPEDLAACMHDAIEARRAA